MKTFLTPRGLFATALSGITVTKILKSPVLLRGTLGSAAVLAAGYTYVKLRGSKKGIQIRQRLATAIRDRAIKTLDSLSKAGEELKNGSEKQRGKAEFRADQPN